MMETKLEPMDMSTEDGSLIMLKEFTNGELIEENAENGRKCKKWFTSKFN